MRGRGDEGKRGMRGKCRRGREKKGEGKGEMKKRGSGVKGIERNKGRGEGRKRKEGRGEGRKRSPCKNPLSRSHKDAVVRSSKYLHLSLSW